jgi:hypothetical protein
MIKSIKSPWLDSSYNNIFRDEISYIEDPIPGEYYKPMKIFKWVYKNKAKKLLFNALAKFVPLFPVVSYHGQISSWLSPSPSGYGNAVFIIIGKDKSGKLRCVGGNYFNSDVTCDVCCDNFWESFDNCKDEFSKYCLMTNMLGYCKKYYPDEDICETERIADFACTMPIYLSVIDNEIIYTVAAPAFVKGKSPADFSYEKLGEVSA